MKRNYVLSALAMVVALLVLSTGCGPKEALRDVDALGPLGQQGARFHAPLR